MNFLHMPELNWRLGYPMALMLMGGICGSLYWRFKRIGWLYVPAASLPLSDVFGLGRRLLFIVGRKPTYTPYPAIRHFSPRNPTTASPSQLASALTRIQRLHPPLSPIPPPMVTP